MSKAFKIEVSTPHQVIAQERLFLTSDRQTVVRGDDPKAAFLLAAAGQVIPMKLAQKLGLVEAPEAKPAAGTDPETRQTRPETVRHKR